MLKRALDLLVAVTGLLVLSPVIALAAAVVRVTMGSPVLFIQERAGFRGRPFRLYKFRTMTTPRGESAESLADDARLTKVGAWLREFSIDELPQLVNVLRGDLSVVGPRPLLLEYLPLYSPEQARRHDVKPGITGWAQVNGRNAISWQEKLKLDIWYVDHRSLALDLRILLLTVARVLRRDGIRQTGQATTEKFKGNPVAE